MNKSKIHWKFRNLSLLTKYWPIGQKRKANSGCWGRSWWHRWRNCVGLGMISRTIWRRLRVSNRKFMRRLCKITGINCSFLLKFRIYRFLKFQNLISLCLKFQRYFNHFLTIFSLESKIVMKIARYTNIRLIHNHPDSTKRAQHRVGLWAR